MKKILFLLLIAIQFSSNAQVTRNWIAQSKSVTKDVSENLTALGITKPRYVMAVNKLINTFKSFNLTQSGFIDLAHPDPKNNCIGVLYLGLGDTDAHRRANFLAPNDTTYRLVASGSSTTTNWGYYTPGTTGSFFNTKIRPYSHLTNKDVQLSIYPIENVTRLIYATLYGDFGCAANNKYCYIDAGGTNATAVFIGSNVGGSASVTSDYGTGSDLHALDGLYCGVRSGLTVKMFKKGVQGTSTSSDINFTSDLDIPMYIGARNNAGTPSVAEKSMLRYVSVGKAIQDNLQLRYSNALNEYVDAINPVVIFFGNSITEGVGASDKEHRWTSVLSQQLDSYLEFNLGLASTRLQTTMDGSDPSHAAYQNRENLIPVKTRKWQYIIFELGYNDLAQGLTDTVRFKTQYVSVINNTIAKGYNPNDIYIWNIPRSYQDQKPVNATIFFAFQRTIKAVAEETGCNYVDIYKHMVDNDTSNLWNTSSGNTVHFNDYGNQKAAEFMDSIINIHI